MNFLKSIFKKVETKSPEKLVELQKNGAVIIDVRTAEEYNAGHIKNSKNYPLQTIGNHLDEISALPSPILAVCKSGNRSGMATKILQSKKIETYNAGGWSDFNTKIGN